MDKINGVDATAAAVVRQAGIQEDGLGIHGVYRTECYGPDGQLKWVDVSPNVITTVGKNWLLDYALANSGTYVSAKMGLVSAGTATAASTYATPIVTEVSNAVIANRATVAWTAASAGAKASTTTTFAIIGTATITGNLVALTSSTTPGDTAASGAILFSAAPFTAGSKQVSSGDSLSVQYSCTIS